ncbi:MAG: hypothetical protein ACU837_06880 [Gammaproteobacteria bacterium]
MASHSTIQAFRNSLTNFADEYYERGKSLEKTGWTAFLAWLNPANYSEMDEDVLLEYKRFKLEMIKGGMTRQRSKFIEELREARLKREAETGKIYMIRFTEEQQRINCEHELKWVAAEIEKLTDEITSNVLSENIRYKGNNAVENYNGQNEQSELSLQVDGYTKDYAEHYYQQQRHLLLEFLICFFKPIVVLEDCCDAGRKLFYRQRMYALVKQIQYIYEAAKAAENSLILSKDQLHHYDHICRSIFHYIYDLTASMLDRFSVIIDCSHSKNRRSLSDSETVDETAKSEKYRKQIHEILNRSEYTRYFEMIFTKMPSFYANPIYQRILNQIAEQRLLEFERHPLSLWQSFTTVKNPEIALVKTVLERDLPPLGFKPDKRCSRKEVLYSKSFHGWTWFASVNKKALTKPEGSEYESEQHGRLLFKFGLTSDDNPIHEALNSDDIMVLSMYSFFPINDVYSNFADLKELELLLLCHLQMYKLVQEFLESTLERITAEHPEDVPQSDKPVTAT